MNRGFFFASIRNCLPNSDSTLSRSDRVTITVKKSYIAKIFHTSTGVQEAGNKCLNQYIIILGYALYIYKHGDGYRSFKNSLRHPKRTYQDYQ